MANPLFDLGKIATIPALADWDHEFTFYEPEAPSDDADYSAVLAVADVVRFRLWQTDGSAAALSFTSSANSANGSSITVEDRGSADTTPARITVDLAGADVTPAGTHKFLIDVQDTSDSSRWFAACKGLIAISGVGTV